MAKESPAAPDPAPEAPSDAEVEQAATATGAAAQAEASRQASAAGVNLTDAELERIGKHAAAEVHRLFEKEGAFRQPEPPPPAAPEPPSEDIHDDAPARKASPAARWLGES